MKIHQDLLQYLQYAPEDIRKQCSIFCESQLDQEFDENDSFSFNGLLFKENRVLVYNILIWNTKDWESPRYLDVTKIFKKLLNYYNTYHTLLILNTCLQKYYRENVLTENNILIFKYYDSKYKHKFRYNTKKHRGRERKFIESHRNRNNIKWYHLLYKSATKDLFISNFGQYKRERPDSLMLDYQKRPIDFIV